MVHISEQKYFRGQTLTISVPSSENGRVNSCMPSFLTFCLSVFVLSTNGLLAHSSKKQVEFLYYNRKEEVECTPHFIGILEL